MAKDEQKSKKARIDQSRHPSRSAWLEPEDYGKFKQLVEINQELLTGPPDFINSQEDLAAWKSDIQASANTVYAELLDKFGEERVNNHLRQWINYVQDPDLIPPGAFGGEVNPDRFYALNQVLFSPQSAVAGLNPSAMRGEASDAGPSQSAIMQQLSEGGTPLMSGLDYKQAFTQGMKPAEVDSFRQERSRLASRPLEQLIQLLGIGGA